MKVDTNRYANIERLLREALVHVNLEISEIDRADVAEYLDYGEYGVAYELLVVVLEKQKISLPDSLRQAGKETGMQQ